MKYIFIVNGSKDKVSVLPNLQAQLSTMNLDHQIYVTTGVGDGTRFVRMFCEFHPDMDCCFVACGGSGTANEVASGILAGKSGHPMAIMQYGTSNDLLKCFPGRNFKSVQELVNGTPIQIDAIKCNDNYAINTINIGFDALVVYEANLSIEEGRKKPYQRGLFWAFLSGRFNRLKILVDGRKISSPLSLSCIIGNGQYCGGTFHCTPMAKLDDGLLDVCLLRSMTLLSFLLIMLSYKKGEHLKSFWFRHSGKYLQGRHVTVSSDRNLFYVSLDGELDVSDRFEIDIMQKAINLILPPAIN